MQFKIEGKKVAFSFWNWLYKLSQKKIKKTEDKTINLISVVFPSAFCLLIRYEVINDGRKYEIALQGDYQDAYKTWKESDENETPDAVNVEWIIKENHKNSKLIANKKIINN